ncbi:MAG: hypothetical protein WCF95_03440 [bacterium]
MDNQVSNNQIYIQKQAQQQQFQAKQNAAQQQQSYGTAKEVAINNTNAGYVASKFDVMQHPWLLLQNFAMGLATAVGITRLGNYLVRPNLDKLKDGISHAEALEHAPLFKLGEKIDAVIEKTPFLKKSVEKMGELKQKISKSPKSAAMKEVAQKYKEGSKVQWSMGKFYEEGKGSEAFDEFVEFLEKAPENAFTDKKTKKFVDEVLKDVKEEKLSRAQAGRKIVENGCLEGISAKHLEEVKIGESKGTAKLIDKLFGTTPNLNSALSKAKFFNDGTKKLGPVSRAFNKLSLMMMEGTGGGLLGGRMAMFMSVFGLISAYNACTKANVAKKEKEKQLAQGNLTPEQIKEMKKKPWCGETISAFMEDFSGFTLGGYLMTFPIGVALNKSLGLANLGRNNEAVKAAAQKMGVQGTDKLYQRSIMKYNEALKHDKKARQYIDYLNGNGGLSLMGKLKKALGLSSDASIKAEMIEKLKLNVPADASKSTLLNALKTKTKEDNWFESTRKMLKTTGKSTLTLKNVFSGKEGTLAQRLTKYAIHKPLELAAKILGPDKFMMYKKGAGFTNKFRRLLDVGGGVGRILLVGMVLTVPFRNAFMKVSHSIFGKPSFSQYDEMKGAYEDKEDKKADKVAPKAVLQPVPIQNEFKKIKLPEQPPIQVLQPGPAPAYTQQITVSNPFQNEIKPQDNYSYIPKNEIADDAEIQGHPVRSLDSYKYVPKG